MKHLPYQSKRMRLGRTRTSHRVMAMFLIMTFLPSLLPVNLLYASNNGPTSPEAASFEPVDATDMVNLATGDLSYVLPLMNVPSPEGGYPLALSYHAGIAMDQEASWVGLGWNLNPGAINRSVNGYPDDWNQGRYKEYFYNKGTTYTDYSFSVGFPVGGGASIGLNLAWGDSRAFGGSIGLGGGGANFNFGRDGIYGSYGPASVGINSSLNLSANVNIGGLSIGTNGIGLNIGKSFGLGISENGQFDSYGSAGIGIHSNWSGDVSANVTFGAASVSKEKSVGISFSSNGIGVSGSVGKNGFGASFTSFSQSVSSSDYNVKQSGFNIPIYIPGILSLSFGKTKTLVYVDRTEDNVVNGPLYFQNNRDLYNASSSWIYVENQIAGTNVYDTANMNPNSDIYEVTVQNVAELSLQENNAAFPNYDNYRVTAQGIGGSMVPIHRKNGTLIGPNKEVEKQYQNFNLTYELPTNGSAYSNVTDFTSMPTFQFENDYSESSLLNAIDFGDSSNNSSIIFSYMNSTTPESISRKKEGRYVEYWTNAQLDAGQGFNQGLMKPISPPNYGYAPQFEQDGIGAFKITAPDGKTYHYAIPVYNHEVVARQYGMDTQYTLEEDAYFEKRQLKKYATHWLLTAITGPDFVDMNNDQRPNNGDYGYWVNFDYGKWSDGYIWYNPHGEDYEISGNNNLIKNYSWGRKEIYYLDKVQTRTHTALFIKEERSDAKGKQLTYKQRRDRYTAVKTFNFQEQSQLRLKEILLLKNDELGSITKSNGTNLTSNPSANTQYTIEWFDASSDGGGTKTIRCSQQNLVLDAKDNNDLVLLKSKANKVVSFGYDYSLATGAPFTSASGRLALKNVAFKGKGDVQLIPSYNFAYENQPYTLADKDEWGYDSNHPWQWSLEEITMPTGGKIQIAYEADTFSSAIAQNISFSTITQLYGANYFEVAADVAFSNFGIGPGSQLPVSHRKVTACGPQNGSTNSVPYTMDKYDGTATVISLVNNDPKKIKLQLDGSPTTVNSVSYGSDCTSIIYNNTYTRISMSGDEFSSGVRVKSLTTTDGVNSYRTDYDYNIPGTSVTSGIVSYIPFGPFADTEIPYVSELPAPIPMYSHVKTTSYGSNNTSLGYTQYEFKTLPTKDDTTITFGDVLQFSKDNSTFTNTTANASVNISNILIKDNTASLGQLMSTATYNEYGQLMNKTINNYASMDNAPQGIVRESYQYYKDLDYTSIQDEWYVNNSTRTTYASSLQSTTVIQGGFSSTTYFDSHDLNTGQLLETSTVQSDGTEFRTETEPAYLHYSTMGSKVLNSSWKNMLTQETMNKTYVKDNGAWKLIGAGINTWNPYYYTPNGGTQQQVWRKHKTYTWNGTSDSNGFFTSYSGDYDGFNWSVTATSQPSDWKLVSQINAYDPFSMVLEVEDINGNKAATKMGDDDTKIIATANAPLNEVHYSGAEYLDGSTFDGGIDDIGRTSERSHTGAYAIKVTSEQGFKTTMAGHRSGKYKISVWASKDNYTNARVYDGISLKSFNGEQIVAGQWVLLNHYVDLTSSSKTIYVTSSSGTTYYDDFRIHPIQSSMTTYVYNDWDELTHILGGNNMGTQYVYNEGGQLCSTYAEVVDQGSLVGGFKIITNNRLQYKNGSYGTCSNITGTISANASVASTNCGVIFDLTGSGGIASWSVNFGDGTSQNGSNNPPSSVNHSYTTTGNKTATLTLTDYSGGTQSYTTSFEVIPAYYFTTGATGYGYKNLTLYGTPGEPIIYGAATGGSGSGFSGFVSVNGVSHNLPSTGSSVSSVNAGVFPASGSVSAYISVSSSSGGYGNTTLNVQKAGSCGTVTASVTIN